jgi:uncharacterized protein YfaP (DUF2135 family)
VISLTWDTNFDLDLHVSTPSGTEFSPKSPTAGLLDAGQLVTSTTPHIDRDSLGGCIPDGLREEDLIFPTAPAPGVYGIVVDPFAACGQQAVQFTVTVYELAGTCPTCELEPVYTQGGELLTSQVTGGASTGLFVHDQVF